MIARAYREFLLVALATALIAGAPLLALAQTPSSTGSVVLDQVITEAERQIIERYVLERGPTVVQAEPASNDGGGKNKGKGKGKGKGAGKNKEMPSGLAKQGGLPPGLAKREALPPGLAKRDLPSDLHGLLPMREGTGIYNVDGNAVLIEAGTGLVLDILEGVLQGH